MRSAALLSIILFVAGPVLAAGPAELIVLVDVSGSVINLPGHWDRIRSRELAQIVERCRCSAITVYTFSDDGWIWKQLARENVAWTQQEQRGTKPNSEYMGLKGIRDREARKQQAANAKAAEQTRKNIAAAVRRLPSISEPVGTTRSDVVTALTLISTTRYNGKRYVLILSDLADSQHRVFPQIPAPVSDVSVLVVHSPAKDTDAKLVFGKRTTAAEQFSDRNKQLSRAAPWARITVAQSEGLIDLFPR